MKIGRDEEVEAEGGINTLSIRYHNPHHTSSISRLCHMASSPINPTCSICHNIHHQEGVDTKVEKEGANNKHLGRIKARVRNKLGRLTCSRERL